MRSFWGLMNQVFSGLRFRLLVLVSLACAPLVALMLHNAGEDRSQAVARWRQKADDFQIIASHDEEELVDGTRQLLLALSESAYVRSLDPRRCQKGLDELFASYPRYCNLGVFTTNGLVLASVRPIAARDNRPELGLFRTTLKTRTFAIGSVQNADDRPSISFGCPVLDRSGQVLAIVFAKLDLQYLDRFGNELPTPLPLGATWTEFDRHGIVLASYPRPGTLLGKRFPEPSIVPTVLSQSKGVVEITAADGARTFYAFGSRPSRLAKGQAGMVLGISRRLLFADADRALTRNLTGLGLAAVFAAILTWLGSRLLILRPVRALVKSSRRLALGDLSVRTGLVHSPDELGELILAFDNMAQALEQRELERQRANHNLQVLSHRLVEVQETERRHIARELHDEIGQTLTVAQMNLQAALQSPVEGAKKRRLEESIRAVERVLEQVHDLSLNLRPSMLDNLGLEPALRWYTQRQAELTGLRAEFKAASLERRLDQVIETECFRVAQEALTNVVRHSRARAVTVDLSRRNGHLHLSVRDDGVGFDVSTLHDQAVNGASLGLLSMEERTALAGGGLEFNSAPGGGTEVHAWFPLKWEAAFASETADEHTRTAD